jgi:uncharacterized SAM-binding protein YcdF (DUF218 family)
VSWKLISINSLLNFRLYLLIYPSAVDLGDRGGGIRGQESAEDVQQDLTRRCTPTAARWLYLRTGLVLLLVSAAFAGQSGLFEHVTEALGGPLERRFERPTLGDAEQIVGLLVLGGGDRRLVEAGRLARLYPHLKLLVSGAGELDYVLLALGGGIAPERVTVETVSRSTFDNAVNSRDVLDPRPGERWLLVTSAIHMARSIGAFRKAGFWPEPWPVYDELDKYAASVAHEWLGLIWYWLSGRGNSLFPGPASKMGADAPHTATARLKASDPDRC